MLGGRWEPACALFVAVGAAVGIRALAAGPLGYDVPWYVAVPAGAACSVALFAAAHRGSDEE